MPDLRSSLAQEHPEVRSSTLEIELERDPWMALIVPFGADAGEEGLGGLVGGVLRDELAPEGALEDRRAQRFDRRCACSIAARIASIRLAGSSLSVSSSRCT